MRGDGKYLGIYGFRVGHALDIVVEGFTKK